MNNVMSVIDVAVDRRHAHAQKKRFKSNQMHIINQGKMEGKQ